ncbi:hypothetical protein [Faecalicatena contorta]
MTEDIMKILLDKAKELDEVSKQSEPEVLVSCTETILKIYQTIIQF